MDSYECQEAYLIVRIHGAYDIPGKTADEEENLLGAHGASNKHYIVRTYFHNSTYRWTQKLPKEDPDVYFALSIYRIRNQKLEGR